MRHKIVLQVPDEVFKELKKKANEWTGGNIKIWLRFAGMMHNPAELEGEELFCGLRDLDLDRFSNKSQDR